MGIDLILRPLLEERMRVPLSVVQYSDYRAYLLAYAQWRKAKSSNWTYGTWARRLGLKATSSITKILQGKREPGSQMVERLIGYFEFNPREAAYFSDLIALNKIKRDPRLSAIVLEKVNETSGQVGVSEIDPRAFAEISQWYCFAIREMTRLDVFFEDEKWISSQFRFALTGTEVRRAIRSLLAVGLLKRDETGKLVIVEKRIETKSDVASEAAKKYFEQMLERTKEAVRSIDVKERDFSASSLVMNQSDLPAAKEMLAQFRRSFCKRFERDNADTLFQFQFQLFPLTVPKEKKGQQ